MYTYRTYTYGQTSTYNVLLVVQCTEWPPVDAWQAKSMLAASRPGPDLHGTYRIGNDMRHSQIVE